MFFSWNDVNDLQDVNHDMEKSTSGENWSSMNQLKTQILVIRICESSFCMTKTALSSEPLKEYCQKVSIDSALLINGIKQSNVSILFQALLIMLGEEVYYQDQNRGS